MNGPLVAIGLLADRVFGEPRSSMHPVVAFGNVMTRVEQRIYDDRAAAGFIETLVGTLLGIAAGLCTPTAAATYVAVGGRALHETACAVGRAVDDGDFERARSLLPTLVGRDPSGLDEREICRAVIESVAENTVDAIVAPALWALTAGGAGALGYRAVNTLDAMVGHRSPRYERFGWASAKLDDIANYVPARVTALLVALARPRRATSIRRIVRDDAPAHPSPNAGVAEAAFAAALDLRLGGTNRYLAEGYRAEGSRAEGSRARVETRPRLGDGHQPLSSDIPRAVRLSSDVEWLLTALATVS